MGQGWCLYVNGKQSYYFGKLGEGLFDGTPTEFVKYLRRPVFPSKPIAVPIHASLPDTSAFATFPDEIIEKIFETLSYSSTDSKVLQEHPFSSMVSLCLTCSRFWIIGERECRRYLCRSREPLMADQRLVVLGDALERENAPEGVFSEEEMDTLFIESDVEPELFDRTVSSVGSWIFWSRLEDEMFQKLLRRGRKSDSDTRRNDGEAHEEESYLILQRDHELFKKFYYQRCVEMLDELLFPSGVRLVLRNLTTKQYVREETIAIPGDFFTAVTLGTALAVRICLSNPRYETNIYRLYEAIWRGPGNFHITQGKWVGDKFDIVDEEQIRGDEWEDVSKEVAREIHFIWSCEFGDWWDEIGKVNPVYAEFEKVQLK